MTTTVPHRLPHAKRLIRVVRDARDASQDYFIPEHRAEELYLQGKLGLVQVYSGRFEYITRADVQVR